MRPLHTRPGWGAEPAGRASGPCCGSRPELWIEAWVAVSVLGPSPKSRAAEWLEIARCLRGAGCGDCRSGSRA